MLELFDPEFFPQGCRARWHPARSIRIGVRWLLVGSGLATATQGALTPRSNGSDARPDRLQPRRRAILGRRRYRLPGAERGDSRRPCPRCVRRAGSRAAVALRIVAAQYQYSRCAIGARGSCQVRIIVDDRHLVRSHYLFSSHDMKGKGL